MTHDRKTEYPRGEPIKNYLRQNPGAYFSEVVEALDLDTQTVMNIFSALVVRGEIIKCDGRPRRWYVTDAAMPSTAPGTAPSTAP